MVTRIVNFKGMVVSHHPDGHFHIVGGAPSDEELQRMLATFQVSPPFLWWPAKKVIFVFLLANVILTVIFLLDSSDFFASLLLASISFSAMFSVGYLHESFLAIFIHLVVCVSTVLLFSILVPVVYYNQTVCNNAFTCKSFHEWLNDIGAPVVASKLYSFSIISVLLHLLMTPVAVRLMKFAAAVEALERFVHEETESGSDRRKRERAQVLFSESV